MGRQDLGELLVNLETYDALDRAEIINAKAWLNAKSGRASSGEIHEGLRYLRLLPPAVSDQLTRMGMLDF